MAIAMGAMNFTMKRNTGMNLALKLPSFDNSARTYFLTINQPTNITIKNPPSGNSMFAEVKLSRPKTFFPTMTAGSQIVLDLP